MQANLQSWLVVLIYCAHFIILPFYIHMLPMIVNSFGPHFRIPQNLIIQNYYDSIDLLSSIVISNLFN